MYDGAPFRFNELMSRNRFENILVALKLTEAVPPTYVDRFWEIRSLVDAWNKNMAENFSPSWVTCLDESMSKWLNKYTCPGFMVVPRKPWPFGNEWHSISCAKSGVMFAVELREGKDQPSDIPKSFNDLGKTVGLLLRLTTSIWHTGRVVILDSGFCVLKGIVELRRRGVFASALIKKRRYWPKHIKGDEIRDHFVQREVGDVDALPGIMDGVSFHVYAMKEPNYVLSLMSTYGMLERKGKLKKHKWFKNGKKQTKNIQVS